MDKNTLVILDLDETLIHSSKKSINDNYTFKFQEYYVYERPYLKKFINSIYSKCKIGIWSAADDEYVSSIVSQIIPKEIKLDLIWSKSWCSEKRNSNGESFFIKEMINISKDFFNVTNLILIDDNEEIVELNKENAYKIKSFFGDQNDSELLKFSELILKL